MADKGHTWIVPTDSYPRLEQGGVVLPWASDPAAAQAFADWLMGPKGVDLLKRYGFGRTEG
jgi:molybdate transport system substrate-binding protein